MRLAVALRSSRKVCVGYTNAKSTPTRSTERSAPRRRRAGRDQAASARWLLRVGAGVPSRPPRWRARAGAAGASALAVTGARAARPEVRGRGTELLLDAQELVVLRDPVAARPARRS